MLCHPTPTFDELPKEIRDAVEAVLDKLDAHRVEGTWWPPGTWVPWDREQPPWTAFEEVHLKAPSDELRRARHRAAGLQDCHLADGAAFIRECMAFRNSRYCILMRELPAQSDRPALWHLLIQRRDGQRAGAERYQDFMRIKDELTGEEREAAEVYPARSREVDAGHVYHLWVLATEGDAYLEGFIARPATRRARANTESALPAVPRPLWTPFVLQPHQPASEERLRERMAVSGLSRESTLADEQYLSEATSFKNSIYLVRIHDVEPGPNMPALWHLNIRRLNGNVPGAERYPAFMRIRDELIGPEHEAIEIYPARSREMDIANAYHLWAVQSAADTFPIGFK
jgi:hypothetical protein